MMSNESASQSEKTDVWENNGRAEIAVRIKNHKCFKDELAGFERIMPINIIIGRNNSGKSALLDLIEWACDRKAKMSQESVAEFFIEPIFPETVLRAAFPQHSDRSVGGVFNDRYHQIRLNWEETGERLLNKRYTIEYNKNRNELFATLNFILLLGPETAQKRCSDILFEKCKEMGVSLTSPDVLHNKTLRRLQAERDIVPEPFSSDLVLQNNGIGATNLINRFLSDSDKPYDLVESIVLKAINEIFVPDNFFTRIQIRQHANNEWEIFLHEEKKGPIPLSKSGSGLKTVILVLLNLLVIPETTKKPKNKFVFAFEELENNLHPALLRRLFKFIENYAIENRCYFFITTHSSAVIDFYSRSEYAQLVHVEHDGERATVSTITEFNGRNHVLDDLGIRASDLLQANGIVWLEGPSDRIYFNKWIEIFSAGELQEHRDYECEFYGGSLLADYGAEDSQEFTCDFVNILNINRNAVLIADSDKRDKNSKLKPRLRKFLEAAKSFERSILPWITAAKEIENYIPASVVRKLFNNAKLQQIGKYELFYAPKKGDKTESGDETPDGADGVCYWWANNKSSNKSFKKVDFASRAVDELPKDYEQAKQELQILDLPAMMERIIERIRSWNTDKKPLISEKLKPVSENPVEDC